MRISDEEEAPGVQATTASGLTERTPLNVVAKDTRSLQRERRRREQCWRRLIIVFAILWFSSLLMIGIVQILNVRASWGAERNNDEITQLNNISFRDYAACSQNITRLLFIRHCDKDDDGSRRHCSAKGFRRAEWLPTLFLGPDARFSPPDHIIARRPTPKHYVRRSIETVTPLSKEIGIPINTNYSSSQVEPFVHYLEDLVHSPDLCGETILVCWKHEQIPDIIHQLGFRVPKHTKYHKKHGFMKWKDSDFDSLVDLQFTRYQTKKGHIKWKLQGYITTEGYTDEDR
mmetsp:Transcript_12386/g.16689  ORF Transcript_12386/g.16689 Transcript_12386/m.16689 type:complete len:288 (-) Transcript_12386:191-1054(-)